MFIIEHCQNAAAQAFQKTILDVPGIEKNEKLLLYEGNYIIDSEIFTGLPRAANRNERTAM